MKLLQTLFLCVLFTVFSLMIRPAQADVQPNSLFGEGAVLQRDTPVPVFGTADSGEAITVRLGTQTIRTTARGGHWQVTFKPMKAGGPFTLTIAGPTNTVTLQDIFVGEVYLCSGQSNMQFNLGGAWDRPTGPTEPNDPLLHLYRVPIVGAVTPQTDALSHWQPCSHDSAMAFSAVAYFFGSELRQRLGVPVGLIEAAMGSTDAKTWTSLAALQGNPSLASLVTPEALAAYQPPKSDFNRPAAYYNGMIAPLIPYGIRGVIWYQGESNEYDPVLYSALLPTLITSWRGAWGEGDFPFLMVQIAPFKQAAAQPQESSLAEVREVQRRTAQMVSNVALAVITDAGDATTIHPHYKRPPGHRLALAAESQVYHLRENDVPVVGEGPEYSGMQIAGSTIVLRFTHKDGGLVAKDGGALTGFAIAGKDRVYVNADAVIDGDTIRVSSPQVANPEAGRFGWANNPVVNLFNGAGLPASPFETDPFPLQKP